MKKKALIFGITGQDGSYLAEFLIKKNYEVHGVKRRSSSINTGRIDHLYQDPHESKKKLYLHYGDITDSTSVASIIKKIKPCEIYNLAAQSHVAVSFESPEYTANADALGALRILESIRLLGLKSQTKFYQASTSELFGNSNKFKQSEKTPFNPQSPYALSKVINAYLAMNYRNNLGIHVINGFSFNHDSSLRPDHFILKKIANYIKNKKSLRKLEVGNINISRDWSWAPEHVDFIYKIMQLKKSDDYIIGTGKSVRLKNIIYYFFRKFNIKKSMLVINKKYIRKHDIINSKSNPEKLKKIFKKLQKTDVFDLVNNLVNEKFL